MKKNHLSFSNLALFMGSVGNKKHKSQSHAVRSISGNSGEEVENIDNAGTYYL